MNPMTPAGEDRVTQLVLRAIDELNSSLAAEERVGPSVEEPLFGDQGKLDSLGLVNLVALTEQRIEDELGVSISLADERALSETDSPFRTVASFSRYVSMLLEEAQG